MKRVGILLVLLLAPASAFAATTAAAQNLVFTDRVPTGQNVYLAGGSVTVATTSPADLTVVGGSVVSSAPVAGDALIAGGSVSLKGQVAGDARILGGHVSIQAPVSGDLAVVAPSIDDQSTAHDVLAIGGTVQLLSGAKGNVIVYGNEIHLAGTFDGNVYASALDKVVLEPGTAIHGSLHYEASEVATIPDSAHVAGGVVYTGASFLPTSQEAEAFALAGIGIFFLVRILGALLVAGLLAGFFPLFANRVANEVLDRPVRRALLTGLLGFGIIVATPVLLFLLSITFIGLGIAFVLGAAYLLLLLLAFSYAGILAGAAFRRVFSKRHLITWRDGVFGMLVLMLIAVVPVLGSLVVALLTFLATGVLISIFYHFAFAHHDVETSV